jgi:hypothetical protein
MPENWLPLHGILGDGRGSSLAVSPPALSPKTTGWRELLRHADIDKLKRLMQPLIEKHEVEERRHKQSKK